MRSRPRGWLVLGEPWDPVGPWLAHGLSERGLAAWLVTSEELCGATRWNHRLGPGRADASFDILLADGRRLRSDGIGGVVNRLAAIPAAYLVRAAEADRAYVEQEWRALLCSALLALARAGAPVVEAAHPYALGGRWRPPAEWALLAARAGLEVAPWRSHESVAEAAAPAGSVAVLVVGDAVLGGSPLSEVTVDACRALARAAGRRILGIDLVPATGASRAAFTGADPMPDLRRGGPPALDALAALLRTGAS